MNKKKLLKIGFVVLICLAIIGIVTVIGINNHVKNVGGRNIITPEEATKIDDIDCIVVLGCQVKDDGKPSDMLQTDSEEESNYIIKVLLQRLS